MPEKDIELILELTRNYEPRWEDEERGSYNLEDLEEEFRLRLYGECKCQKRI